MPNPDDARLPVRGPWSRSTTRPGSTSWHAACTRPVSRWSRPARPRAGSPPRASRSRRWRTSPASRSASTAGSRRCTPRCTPASWPTAVWRRTAPSWRSSASRRSTSWSRTSTPSPTPSRAAPRPTSASSRSTSAARRWCAPPPRTTPPSRSSPLPRSTATCWTPYAPEARPSSSADRLAADAFVHTATYDVNVASWMGSVVTDTSEGTGFPAWIGGTWDKSAVLRYGENPHQRAALYTNGITPRVGSRRRPSTTARRCPTTTTSTPTRPAARSQRLRRAGRRDHQARQPVRHRGRRRRGAGAPQGARLRPGLGVRRRHRQQRTGQRRDGRAGRGGIHRGRRRPGLRGRRGRGAGAQEERPGAGVRPAGPRRHRDASDLGPHVCRRPVTTSTPWSTRVATTRPPGRSRPGRPRRRPGVRLEGRARGEVQRDPACARDGASVGVGMGRPTGVHSCRLAADLRLAPGGRPARWPPPTPSSPSPTARRSSSTRASRADRAARRVRARRRGGRGPRGRPASTTHLDRRPGTSATDLPPSTKGHRERTDPGRYGDCEGDQGLS